MILTKEPCLYGRQIHMVVLTKTEFLYFLKCCTNAEIHIIASGATRNGYYYNRTTGELYFHDDNFNNSHTHKTGYQTITIPATFITQNPTTFDVIPAGSPTWPTNLPSDVGNPSTTANQGGRSLDTMFVPDTVSSTKYATYFRRILSNKFELYNTNLQPYPNPFGNMLPEPFLDILRMNDLSESKFAY